MTALTPARANIRRFMPLVRDQGERSTCLAFAATAANEWPRMEDDRLSEEAIYAGGKRLDTSATPGVSIDGLREALARWGQPSEVDWPYDGAAPDEVQDAPAPSAGWTWRRAALRDIDLSMEAIAGALVVHGPVMLGLVLSDAFIVPHRGRVADPLRDESTWGSHAVSIVGARSDLARYLARNSWGDGWGVEGHAWISQRYVDSYGLGAWALGDVLEDGVNPAWI